MMSVRRWLGFGLLVVLPGVAMGQEPPASGPCPGCTEAIADSTLAPATPEARAALLAPIRPIDPRTLDLQPELDVGLTAPCLQEALVAGVASAAERLSRDLWIESWLGVEARPRSYYVLAGSAAAALTAVRCYTAGGD